MTQEDMERTTINNAKAIGELTIIAKQTSKDVDKLITHLDAIPATRIIATEKRLQAIELKITTFISGTVVRWGIGGLVTAAGLYILHMETIKEEHSKELHRLDKLAVEKIHMQRQINKNVENRLNRNDDFLGLERFNIGFVKHD